MRRGEWWQGAARRISVIALLSLAFGAEPVPPARVTDKPRLLEPIEDGMSPRTMAKVKVPSMVLLEWHGGTELPELGSWIDLWTPHAQGVCSPLQRVEVVLGPKATDPDLVHSHKVIRIPSTARETLFGLKAIAWTPRDATDPRTYPSVACPAP